MDHPNSDSPYDPYVKPIRFLEWNGIPILILAK